MEPEKKTNGALVGSIIIIIILVIGGIYIWQTIKQAPVQPENITTEDSASLEELEADIETKDTDTGVDADPIE